MKKLNKKDLTRIINERLSELDRLDKLSNKVELIESEIKSLVGEDFDPDEFFGDAKFAAQSDIEDEYGSDEFLDDDELLRGLDMTDENSERMAPEYYPEKRRNAKASQRRLRK